MTDPPPNAPPNTESSAPDPEPLPEIPVLNEDEWLATQAQWTDEELRNVIFSAESPNACKIAARQRMAANEGLENRFSKPGAAFDRITNRTLGKPKEDPKVVINQTSVLNIGTEHLFDNIRTYLAGEESTVKDFRLEPRPLLAGPDNGQNHPEEPARERNHPAGDPAGGGG